MRSVFRNYKRLTCARDEVLAFALLHTVKSKSTNGVAVYG